jgi:tyrosyl-tRNA synthetase
VDLVRKLTGDQAFGLTTPLLTKADGTKLGKSTVTNENVWLDRTMTSPYLLYQFFMNLEDEVVGTMLRLLTFLGHDEILELEAKVATAPGERAAQRRLAYELVTFVHSSADADAAVTASEALFDEALFDLDRETLEAVTADVPSTSLGRDAVLGGVRVVELLTSTGVCSSLGDARRAIDQGGVYVNNRKVADVDAIVGPSDLLFDRYVLLRRGKRNPHLVVAG